MTRYFLDLVAGARSLVKGLGVTLGELFRPAVTVPYPREKLEIPAAFRGHTELVRDPRTGTHRCIVCLMCQTDCPSSCILVKGEKREGATGKVLTAYQLDFTRCSLCGLCVEVCPTAALRFSREYALAGFSRDRFRYDLLTRLEEAP